MTRNELTSTISKMTVQEGKKVVVSFNDSSGFHVETYEGSEHDQGYVEGLKTANDIMALSILRVNHINRLVQQGSAELGLAKKVNYKRSKLLEELRNES